MCSSWQDFGTDFEGPVPLDEGTPFSAYFQLFLYVFIPADGVGVLCLCLTEVEKAMLLAVCLRGAASTVLSNLPVDRQSNYMALMTALENHFGTAELHRMKLRN